METKCPDCEKSFDVPDEFDGQPGKCSNCGSAFTISSTVMITAGGLSEFMPELPPLNEPDAVYHSDTTAAVLEQDSFDAPVIPPGCVSSEKGPRNDPVRRPETNEDTTEAENHAYFDDLNKKENKKKKKQKSFSLSHSGDGLPGDGFATFMFTFGIIGLIASYTLLVVGLSQNLMLALHGYPNALRRLLLWLGSAAVIMFISVLKLSFANIIKAINANTRRR